MKTRVLIIDDEQTLARNIARCLRRVGCIAYTVGSAREARVVLSNGSIDVLCLDIGLPDCDGLDLLAEIRRSHPVIPVVVMTCHSTRENVSRSGKLGAAAFFSKPFPLSKLKEAVSVISHNALREVVNET